MAMTTSHTLTLCDCCTMALMNGDTSGCRDYHGHTHPDVSVPPNTVVSGDAQEWMSHFDTRCDGHGGEIEYGGTYYAADVLVPAHDHYYSWKASDWLCRTCGSISTDFCTSEV